MDKNLKREQGGAGGSGFSQIEELAYALCRLVRGGAALKLS